MAKWQVKTKGDAAFKPITLIITAETHQEAMELFHRFDVTEKLLSMKSNVIEWDGKQRLGEVWEEIKQTIQEQSYSYK